MYVKSEKVWRDKNYNSCCRIYTYCLLSVDMGAVCMKSLADNYI